MAPNRVNIYPNGLTIPPWPTMLKTVPIINNKGGVGKTTTAVNLAAGLALRGRNVLLVDLDSQGSASLSFGVEHDDLSPSAADVLFDNLPVEEAIRSTRREKVDLLTGSLELANADVRLKDHPNGQYQLAEMLAAVDDQYQTIIIDCAPSTSILSVNALVAADAFIVPVSPSYLALEGVVSLGETVRRVRQRMGEAAPILGVLLTMVDREDDGVTDAIDQVRAHYGGKVFDRMIGRDPALEEAPSHDQDIFDYAPHGPGGADYGLVVDEVEKRLQRYGSVYDTLRNGSSTGTTTPSEQPSVQ
jgi:chromosome partitioning protein